MISMGNINIYPWCLLVDQRSAVKPSDNILPPSPALTIQNYLNTPEIGMKNSRVFTVQGYNILCKMKWSWGKWLLETNEKHKGKKRILLGFVNLLEKQSNVGGGLIEMHLFIMWSITKKVYFKNYFFLHFQRFLYIFRLN